MADQAQAEQQIQHQVQMVAQVQAEQQIQHQAQMADQAQAEQQTQLLLVTVKPLPYQVKMVSQVQMMMLL